MALSEKTKSRMKQGLEAGRWLFVAPIGYLNFNKEIIADPERSALVSKAFELAALGRFTVIG
ncbi:MAG: hypothetical protein ACRD2U_03295 [Terriglobales bacterium]